MRLGRGQGLGKRKGGARLIKRLGRVWEAAPPLWGRTAGTRGCCPSSGYSCYSPRLGAAPEGTATAEWDLQGGSRQTLRHPGPSPCRFDDPGVQAPSPQRSKGPVLPNSGFRSQDPLLLGDQQFQIPPYQGPKSWPRGPRHRRPSSRI